MEEINALLAKLKNCKENNEIDIHLQLADKYRVQQEYEKSLEHSLKANNLLTILQDESGRIDDYNIKLLKALSNIAHIFTFIQDDKEKGLSYYLKSLKIAELTENLEFQVISLQGLGFIQRFLGNYNKSSEYFQTVVELLQDEEDSEKMVISLNEIANNYCYSKSYPKSLEYHEKAIELAQKINYQYAVSFISHDMGLVYFSMEDFDKALEYFHEALKIDGQFVENRFLAVVNGNVANSYLSKKDYSQALIYAQKALDFAREFDGKAEIKSCYFLLAVIYRESGEYEKAYENLEEYINLKEKMFNEESQKKIAEMQTRYDTERKVKEAELAKSQALILKLKNVELAKANSNIKLKNTELQAHREHLRIINQILRHDLMNNLSKSLSALNLFEDSFEKEMLQEARNGIWKSTELINRMRELETFIADNQNLKFYQLDDVINQISGQYSELHVTLEGSCHVLADEALESVIDNIFRNAVVHSGSASLQILIKQQNNVCEVRFADQGKGIPDEYKEKVFEELFQYGLTGHTGLGLFIVRKTMERYGGSAFIEDNKPQGTIVVLVFKMLK